MGWDAYFRIPLANNKISIHPPRMGWDKDAGRENSKKNYFNPPTPHGVGHVLTIRTRLFILISIHPPRMGWDAFTCGRGQNP